MVVARGKGGYGVGGGGQHRGRGNGDICNIIDNKNKSKNENIIYAFHSLFCDFQEENGESFLSDDILKFKVHRAVFTFPKCIADSCWSSFQFSI